MFSQDWPEIRRLIQMVRRRFPSVPIVAGGEHITATSEFTLNSTPEVDVCVIGEGEETIVELADAVDRRRVVTTESLAWFSARTRAPVPAGSLPMHADSRTRSTGSRTRIRNLDEIPWPAWDLVPLDQLSRQRTWLRRQSWAQHADYRHARMPVPVHVLLESRDVDDALVHARSGSRCWRRFRVYQERYGATNFDFYDLTAIVKRSWIIQFTTSIIDRKMAFTWQLPSGTRSEAIDDEVSRLLYESGCRNMSYAPESGSPEVLKRIKKVVKLDKLEASVLGRRPQWAEREAQHHHGIPERVAQGARPDRAVPCANGPGWRPRHEHLALFAISGLRAVPRASKIGADSRVIRPILPRTLRLQGLLAVDLVHRGAQPEGA